MMVSAYAFRAELLCAACVIPALPTGEGEPYDGWKLAPTVNMTTEANLDEVAMAFGIDRYDESSYDSDEFPKVVFGSDLADGEHCGACGTDL